MPFQNNSQLPCHPSRWFWGVWFDMHLNKNSPCVSHPCQPVQHWFHFMFPNTDCPSRKAPDMMFGSAPLWEIHEHKEWHLERQVSISPMQISESHCGWNREQKGIAEWTADTQVELSDTGATEHASSLQLPTMVGLSYQGLSCSLFSPATYQRYNFPARVTWNIPRSFS